MGSIFMAVAIVSAFGFFSWSAFRKFKLLKLGASEDRFDRIGERIKQMLVIAFFQTKMPKYKVMGPIHMLIFWGFLVLLINTVILWGRGFDPTFDLFIFGDTLLGHTYHFIKDIVAALVLVAAGLALLNRVIIQPKRLTKSAEAGLILLIIITMMIADMLYWGNEMLKSGGGGFNAAAPFASIASMGLSALGPATANLIGIIGFWAHAMLVLIFLNLLPYGKHFHVVCAIPNVFFSNLGPAGRLPTDLNIEKELKDDDDAKKDDDDEDEDASFGVSEIRHFTWKDMLDMFSCTECGRCTDNCPAAKTGKPLSPKQFLCDLRNHLYSRQAELLSGKVEVKELIPEVIKPEVVWSCTTCRACEEECPVTNTFVEKIVKMRRDLVENRGKPPAELAVALRGMETNQNPWNISAMDRDGWAEDMDVPEFNGKEHEYLLFVGCAGSFDDRAKKITRAVVKLLKEAKIGFGYLGTDEPCCGETARRGGSESNFRMMLDENVESFKDLGVKKIITACPHCFNTFKNEYPVFGGEYEVTHHTELLASLVKEGKIVPKDKIAQKVTYHDACYLGRYNSVFEPPRDILRAIPGIELEDVATSKKRGLCCGGGGGRFFMEEEGERVNNRRVGELLEASPKTIASACPYCMTMLSDGLKAKDLFDSKGQLDVAELLAISAGLEPRKALKETA
jgi:Fe-S oxidoreductase